MQTTKNQILALLKRRGRYAVDALAEELRLAPMTVRQHLTSLERDGLIEAAVERQAKGRPHYVYTLTSKGDDSFPKRYDQLAAQVLSELGRLAPYEIAGLDPAERTDYILSRIADKSVALYATRLDGSSLENRIRDVAQLLQRESGFVEWSKTAAGYEIRDFNCMYRAITAARSPACAWHRRLLSQLLGPPLASSEGEVDGSYCRYETAVSALEAKGSGGDTASAHAKHMISQEVF